MMMRKLSTWVVLSIALLIALGVTYQLSRPVLPEWTARRPEALAEFERGLDAERKHYFEDAVASYHKALDLEPGLAAARIRLALLRPPSAEGVAELVEPLRQVDISRLSAREQALARYVLARQDAAAGLSGGSTSPAQEVLERSLHEHPDDPFLLDVLCARQWMRGQLAEAEKCYEKLLLTDPNWVEAQNRLGYIAMAQGHFAEAEERFRTYRYIAPDQANPHDSLGELLLLLGRYREAEQELEQALATRPGFCHSYGLLAWVWLIQDDYERATATLERAARDGECTGGDVAEAACSVAVWQALEARDYDAVLRLREERCRPGQGDGLVAAHLAALLSNQPERALALEAQVEARSRRALPKGDRPGDRPGDQLDDQLDGGPDDQQDPPVRIDRSTEALLLHMRGNRLALAGSPAAAAELFRQADARLTYWSDFGLGLFKLYNQHRLSISLTRAGATDEAAAVELGIRAINPHFAQGDRDDE